MRTLASLIALSAVWAPLPAAAQQPGDPVSIFAARVLDGRGAVIRNATVVVDRGRILRIEPRRVENPTFAFERGTLLPGLIDVHVHLASHLNRQGRLHTPDDGEPPAAVALRQAGSARATLESGFTTVQSLGAIDDAALRDAVAAGQVSGPRVLTSLNPITDASLDPDALRAEVRRRAEAGADLVKIFASRSIRDGGAATLSPEQLGAACGEARALGLRAVVHAHDTTSIRAAARAGCHQVEHGLLADPATLAFLAERGVYFAPQCGLVFRNYLDHRARFRGIGNFTDAGFAAMERAVPIAVALMREAALTPGLKLVFGTDALAGAHGRNVDDLICRVRQAGQRAGDAIVTATSLAAESLGLAGEVGSVAAGLRADLLVVAGNPLDDMTALTRVLLVMRDGRIVRYDPAASPSR